MYFLKCFEKAKRKLAVVKGKKMAYRISQSFLFTSGNSHASRIPKNP
jgi:hypothetical protein